jgi:integrase
LPSRKTVKECAEGWFERRFANDAYERSTRVERKNHINNYIIPAFGSMLVQNLSVERIEQEALEWNKRVAALVVKRVLRTLAAILAEAKRYKIIKDNPAKEAKPEGLADEPKEPRRRRPEQSKKKIGEKEIFTAEELRRVIEATEPESRERVVIMLMAFTGCRVGEILGASWDAVDLKAEKFHIRASLADAGRGEELTIKCPKTKSSNRTVPLSKELVHELKLWKLKCPPSDKDLVIASDLGKPMRRNFVCTGVKRIVKDLKIEKRLTPHSFRHTFASLLLANKRPVPEVSQLLGHKNAGITYGVYSHCVPGEETGAVQSLVESVLATPVNK